MKTSWFLAATLLGLHAGALIIALTLPLPWGARVALAILVSLSAYVTVRRHALRQGEGAVQAVELDHSGDWRLSMGGHHDTLGPCCLRA
ncbi:MAG: hypothetical protein R3268_10950, partial [Acidiferrobacterales bacterium]|nr:hypothetical protein [Acidiferrobacterales bacterium]